jgi:serine protease
VVSVSATTSTGNLASYSNFGSSVTVAAPGGSNPDSAAVDHLQAIFSTSNEGANAAGVAGYSYATGTSMAAPLVTGVLALMLSVDGTLTRAQLISMLRASVKPFATQSGCRTNGLCGAGIVDAATAVELADLKHW